MGCLQSAFVNYIVFTQTILHLFGNNRTVIKREDDQRFGYNHISSVRVRFVFSAFAIHLAPSGPIEFFCMLGTQRNILDVQEKHIHVRLSIYIPFSLSTISLSLPSPSLYHLPLSTPVSSPLSLSLPSPSLYPCFFPSLPLSTISLSLPLFLPSLSPASISLFLPVLVHLHLPFSLFSYLTLALLLSLTISLAHTRAFVNFEIWKM